METKEKIQGDLLKELAVLFQKDIFDLTGLVCRVEIYRINMKNLLPSHIKTPNDIIAHVSNMLEIPFETIKSVTRKQEVQDAAKIATVLVDRYFKFTQKKLGQVMRDQPIDHATVRTRLRTHEDLLVTDPVYLEKFKKCLFDHDV